MSDFAIACEHCTWTAVGDVDYVRQQTAIHRLHHRGAGGGRAALVDDPVFWTREKVVYAVRSWVSAYGTPPREHEWLRAPSDCPDVRVVRALFGTWSEGVTAAGYSPRARERAYGDEAAPDGPEAA